MQNVHTKPSLTH